MTRHVCAAAYPPEAIGLHRACIPNRRARSHPGRAGCTRLNTTATAYGPALGLPDTKVGMFTQALYDEAKKNGWNVISMKNDWKRIFARSSSFAPGYPGDVP